MATSIVFSTSTGCSASATHTTSPTFKGSFTLTADKQLTVTFKDVGSGNFNFDVGYVAISASGTKITDRDRLSFGKTANGGNFGYGNSVKFTANLSNFTFPITLYFTCGGCDYELNGGSTPIKWQSSDGWIITEEEDDEDEEETGGGTIGSSPKITASSSGKVSATTISATLSWTSTDTYNEYATITCGGSRKSISNGGTVGFTGLTPGNSYTISFQISGTYDIYEYDEEKKDYVIVGTGTETASGSYSLTTKKATLVIDENSDITSKIIRFKSYSNVSSDTMQQKVSAGWASIAQNTYRIYDNLTHDTSYTIYCRIKGCYAYDSSGNKTSTNDSMISKTVTTKLLSLNSSIVEEKQHSVVTLWQAYVAGVARDRDAIDNTLFTFTYMDTLAIKNNPPYQASEVIEGSDGETIGNYQTDKKIYSNNLTWYYCEYIITASLTDGFNIVANTIIVHTIFPAAWIYSGGQWHRYMGHVYTNGKYVPAPAFIYNNKFKEPNGE